MSKRGERKMKTIEGLEAWGILVLFYLAIPIFALYLLWIAINPVGFWQSLAMLVIDIIIYYIYGSIITIMLAVGWD